MTDAERKLVRAAEWRYRCDEWRKHCARKRAHLYDAVSLDCVRDPLTGETHADLIPDPRAAAPPPYCVKAEARWDVQYLFWYLEYHGYTQELEITKMVYRGFSFHAIARHLNQPWSTFHDVVLPRWQGLCQQILNQ